MQKTCNKFCESSASRECPSYPARRVGLTRSSSGVIEMTLRVVPEGLADAGAAVEALTARLASAEAGAAPLITAVVPPAADPVSLEAAAGFSVAGNEHAAVVAQGTEELGRSGVGVSEAGISYAAGDAAAASSYR